MDAGLPLVPLPRGRGATLEIKAMSYMIVKPAVRPELFADLSSTGSVVVRVVADLGKLNRCMVVCENEWPMGAV